jgi:heptosyltransferase-2
MNIAVFLPNWIGDVVMATPALRALKEQFRQARFIGVLRPYVVGVLDGRSWFDRTLLLDREPSRRGDRAPGTHGLLSAAWQLRKEKIDLAVLFPNSLRSALIAWLGGCRRIVGYARDGRGLLLTDRLMALRDPQGRFLPSPIIDAYNRLAEHVGCPRPGYRMTLFTTAEDEEAAEGVWQKFNLQAANLVVALNSGAAFGSAKHWPADQFAELARRLIDERGAAVLVLCGPGEKDMARHIVELIQRKQAHSLAEEAVSIGLLKACVRRADLLVTTDSGPRHFAAAFDRPVVTLFGPTHIAWTETYFEKAIHKQVAVPCGPCQLRVCPLDHRCMQLLSPSEVFDAAGVLLTRYSRPANQSRGWSWFPFRRGQMRRTG